MHLHGGFLLPEFTSRLLREIRSDPMGRFVTFAGWNFKLKIFSHSISMPILAPRTLLRTERNGTDENLPISVRPIIWNAPVMSHDLHDGTGSGNCSIGLC